MKTRLESLDIAVDGQCIAASLLAPTTSVPGILFVHGWGGSQEQDLERAREAAGLGCVCLTFDLRGHRRTEQQRETVTREDNLRDLLAAYDKFAAMPLVDASAIAVVGSSYGAYLGALLTSLRPVRWLALRAPALYKDTDWSLPKRKLHLDPDLPAFRRREVRAQENRALAACAAFRGDVLIVESEHDDFVPHPVIANYVAAFTRSRSLTTRVLSGADHGISQLSCQRAYTAVLVRWLTEMVIGARGDAVDPEVPSETKKTGGEARGAAKTPTLVTVAAVS
jgi:pimeloyl-ACP methyl ester carboxylesterase